VVIREGGQYVAEHPDSADVLMVDGSMAFRWPILVTQRYYDDCAAALSERVVLAVKPVGQRQEF